MGARHPEIDTLEDLDFMAQNGVGAIEGAKRAGFSDVFALEKWLVRHGERDLFARLRKNDPIGELTRLKTVRPRAAAPTTKACTKCKKVQPTSEFYPDNQMKDGLQSHCRTCNNDRQPTVTKLVYNRARRRAAAYLEKKYAEEFAARIAIELEHARTEHERLTAAAAARGQSDAEVARLKPGPKRTTEADTVERLDVARCPSCHTHHDDVHVCPSCGDTTPERPDEVKPYMIRAWAIANDLAPVPARGPLPERILLAYAEAHADQADAS